MATLKDIAELCQTSTATVSYVLSGRGEERRISAEMQARVKKAADEMGYRYSLKNRQHSVTTIGIFWPQHHLEMLLTQFVNGLNAALALSARPAEASICPFERGYLERQPFLWAKGRFDAAIVVSPNQHDMEALVNRKTGIPTVLYNRSLPGYYSVHISHDEVAKLAFEKAVELGENNVALITPTANLYGADIRVKKLIELYAQRGLDIRGQMISISNDVDAGYMAGQRLLLEKRLKKVIICVYDVVALGVASALRDSGVQLGRDVEVIAMSSIYERMVHRVFPEIRMIDMRLSEVATLTVNMAIEAGNEMKPVPREIQLQPKWNSGGES